MNTYLQKKVVRGVALINPSYDSIFSGPIVRVSPNELAFASVTAWQAIYGVPPAGQSHLIKSEFYDIFGGGFEVPCIGSERDPAEHARKKKSLAAAFSTKALTAQEHVVQRCFDDFITKLGPASQKMGLQGINVVSWFEMVTFDILGEMAFGESFGCIENGIYGPTSHPSDTQIRVSS
jgi:hypothetical protein